MCVSNQWALQPVGLETATTGIHRSSTAINASKQSSRLWHLYVNTQARHCWVDLNISTRRLKFKRPAVYMA